MKGALGVLGGMGPLATADFLQKVIKATPAERDQEHIPILVYAVPQVPDRTESILSGNDEPLTWMRQGLKVLRNSGAECIAIPCNTAHYWYDQLIDGFDIPILHIVDATASALANENINGGPVGLLATAGTITAGVYQTRFSTLGYDCLAPNHDAQINGVTAGIAAVKAGDFLEKEERKKLIDNLFATQNPYYCPHGRPIVVSIKTDELDKRFERK